MKKPTEINVTTDGRYYYIGTSYGKYRLNKKTFLEFLKEEMEECNDEKNNSSER